MQNAVDPNAEPKRCPNLLKLKTIFSDMLKQYADFVEWSLGENNDQGKYLISMQKCFASLMLEPQHAHGYFDCVNTSGAVPVCHAMPKIPEANASTTAAVNKRIGTSVDGPRTVFLPKEANVAAGNDDPLFVAACEIQKEPSIVEEESVCSPVSSSLSCFDFDGKIYASNKVMG